MKRRDFQQLAEAIGRASALNPSQGSPRFLAELMLYLKESFSSFDAARFSAAMLEARAIAQKGMQEAAESEKQG